MGKKTTDNAKAKRPTVQIIASEKNALVKWLREELEPNQGMVVGKLVAWFLKQPAWMKTAILKGTAPGGEHVPPFDVSKYWLRINDKTINLLNISMIERVDEGNGVGGGMYRYHIPGMPPGELTMKERAHIETKLVTLGIPFYRTSGEVNSHKPSGGGGFDTTPLSNEEPRQSQSPAAREKREGKQ